MSKKSRGQRRDESGQLLRKDGEIDRRCPPKEHRFRPGQCGNPKGRSKNEVPYIEEQLFEAMNERITVTVNGRRKRMTKWQAATKQLSNRAATGDLRAIKTLLQISTLFKNPNIRRPITIVFEAGDENL